MKSGKRPQLPPPSEDTLYFCNLLAAGLLSWPAVTTRPMFGMRAFYRDSAIFAMLPGKRSLESPSAIAYKLDGKWHTCEVRRPRDLDAALRLLRRACSAR